MRNFMMGMLTTMILAIVGTSAIVWGGWFPVAATGQKPEPLRSLIHTTYERAVARAATDIAVPDDLGGEDQVLRGAYSFQAMCAGCHTPPGAQRSVQAQGMNPPPPRLAELLEHRTPGEAVWVIENGVRMTAMPAFGPTHDAEDLWALVAFLRAAPSAADYQALVAQARERFTQDDGHDHSHGENNGAPAKPPADGKHDDNGGAHDHGAASGRQTAPAPDGHAGHDHHGAAAEPPDAAADIPAELSRVLAAGDQEALRGLLDSAVLVFESGGVEDGWAEYAGHHMPADMAFMANMQRKPLSQKIFEFGDHALVATRSSLHGRYKGKAVDLVSTESLLLQRRDGRWRIQHIHWSSGDAH